jgi:hypothetical protein
MALDGVREREKETTAIMDSRIGPEERGTKCWVSVSTGIRGIGMNEFISDRLERGDHRKWLV